MRGHVKLSVISTSNDAFRILRGVCWWNWKNAEFPVPPCLPTSVPNAVVTSNEAELNSVKVMGDNVFVLKSCYCLLSIIA